jgi:hypothetical protein
MVKKWLAIAGFLSASIAHAFMPQSGAWIINGERNGEPGRGFVLDAQNNLLGVQVFAYESNGAPTFYLASGILQNNRLTAPLIRYTGGRYFGSGPRNAVTAGSPGDLKIRFTSGITGYITFPGETEVAISRFNFGYPWSPSSLKGGWTLTSTGSEGLRTDAVELSIEGPSTSYGNGLVATANGLFGCEHQTSGNLAGLVICAQVNTSGTLQRGYYFAYSVNEGEGASRKQGTGPEQELHVRRITTAQDIGTGIVHKSAEEQAPPHPALLTYIRQITEESAP